MEISTKLMTNSANGIQKEIKVIGQKLGTVTSFNYPGAVVTDDGSSQTGSYLKDCITNCISYTKLKLIWRDNNILLGSKMKEKNYISILLPFVS